MQQPVMIAQCTDSMVMAIDLLQRVLCTSEFIRRRLSVSDRLIEDACVMNKLHAETLFRYPFINWAVYRHCQLVLFPDTYILISILTIVTTHITSVTVKLKSHKRPDICFTYFYSLPLLVVFGKTICKLNVNFVTKDIDLMKFVM